MTALAAQLTPTETQVITGMDGYRIAFSGPGVFSLATDQDHVAPASCRFHTADEARMAALTAEILVVGWMERRLELHASSQPSKGE